MKKQKIELNETIIFECKTHWMALLRPAILGAFFFLSFLVEIKEDFVYSLIFLLIAVLVFGIPFLRIKTTHLTLTDKRIFGKQGIFNIKELSSPIAKIQTVNIDKKILGRFLGYADISIHCITGIYIFKKQMNAEEMQNAILNTIK